MLKHYLKIAFRNLWRNKSISVINIIGLATGLATCLLIILYVLDELSYDRYNLNAGRIYRVGHDVKFGGNHFDLAQAPAAMGPETVREFPQVEQYVRFSWHYPVLIKKGEENLRETKVTYADSTLFDVFTLPLIAGNAKTALKEPHSIVITETMAHKYFNMPDPVGQTLLIDNKENYKITAVIKDIPQQSHFNFDIFLPMCENEDSRNGDDGWISENYNTYLLFKKGTDATRMLPEFDKMLERHVSPILKNTLGTSLEEFKRQGSYVRNTLTPLTDIHLRSNKMGELGANGSITYTYIFSAIAVFILLIACVNFMNLSTARSSNRAKEVGVRKVLGSLRKNLIRQFLTESLIVSFLSLLLALLMAITFLHWFNILAEKQIRIHLLFQPSMLFSLFLLMFVAGLLAGSYPAFFLSAFKPVEVLKGKLAGGFKNSWLRNSLVVFQFAVSIILIAGTLVIYNQLNYIRHKDIGFDRDQVLIIQNTNALNGQAVAFRNELLNISGVSNATMTGYLPVNGDRSNDAFFTTPLLDPKTAVSMQKWTVDENYIPALGIKLMKGRNFLRVLPSDSNAVIVNEAAAKMLATTDPVNKKLYRLKGLDGKQVIEHTIVGVVKNFNFNSLRDMITPLALRFGKDNNSIAVRIKSNDVAGVLTQVKTKWQAMSPSNPFIYSFMDEEFQNQYHAEQRTGKIFITFATLAILIACLGLFGLASYAAEQRTKEIGIRKVLGASVNNIARMLSKDFLKLVLIASVIAFPVAAWAMNQWLQDFAYRVSISWWIFFVSGMIALLIALFTVAYQAIKAATMNPAKSLRTE